MARVHRILFAVSMLAVSTLASAEIPSDGLLNDVTDRFLAQSATWGATIISYASWLFWILATISMVWTFGLMALRQADIGEFFAEFIRFSVTTGFFWWILANGPAMAMAIINSLRQVGAQAGKMSAALEPSTPISIGFDIVRKAFSGLSWVHPIDNLAIVLISACLVLCMAIVAANVLIALVTAWTMAYAGVFILGFGGARWTSEMAIAYFKSMLGIGLELLTVTLLVGIAVSVIDGFYSRVNAQSVYELLLVLCVCAVLAMLTNSIPARVAALAGGGSGANVSAGSIMGAAAMGAAAVASAGTAVAAGAASAAGGAQALMAAFSNANASESPAGGHVGRGGDNGSMSSSGSGSGTGTTGADTANSNGSTLASAMGDSGSSSHSSPAEASVDPASPTSSSHAAEKSGDAPGGLKGKSTMANARGVASKMGKVAAGTISNLAQGSLDVAKSNLSNRIANTAGGKIAAAIQGGRQVADKETDSPTFEDDSLSAGKETADATSEVAAFRDHGTKGS